MTSIIVVLDIGKTNIKICALDAHSGALLDSMKCSNDVIHGKPYPHADITGIWVWFCKNIKVIAKRYDIRFISFTTHGATCVCLAEGKIAFPVLDYESELCEKTNNGYLSLRPDYSETLSPALKGGLNLGQQLYWLSQTMSDDFSRIDTILMYPQYWSWRMSGIACSEVTSLGCHTDLWQPLEKTYSSLVKIMNWSKLFPELRSAGEILGPVLPELAKELGLPVDCQVINGIHDSNASLVPYLQHTKPPFSVISTGTWTVIAGVGSAIDNLSEKDDMLANVTAYGDPVPCIRFMGGREWKLLRGSYNCDQSDLDRVLTSDVFLMPSFSLQGGPFRHLTGETIGDSHQLTSREKTALATLYCALMTDYCLNRINSAGDIYIEGSFAQNKLYLNLIQSLRGTQIVKISHDSTGTTQGAAQIIPVCDWPLQDLLTVENIPPIDASLLLNYRTKWLEKLQQHSN